MNAAQFKHTGILIVSLIVITTLIQAYYIYEDYLENRRLFVQEVQQCLDNSVELYFADLAKSDVLTFADSHGFNINLKTHDTIITSGDTIPFVDRLSKSPMVKNHLNLIQKIEKNELPKPAALDSVNVIIMDSKDKKFSQISVDTKNNIKAFFGREPSDSLSQLKNLTNRIVISITRDSLDFPKLSQFLQEELNRNHLQLAYQLQHMDEGSLVNTYRNQPADSLPLEVTSKSTYLPPNQRIDLQFENASIIILKKGMGKIAFGVFFIILVSGVLGYLYRVIKTQKELSEIKNDLIQNITHEFKTPIATVSAAVEGIRNFNVQNDLAKTNRYLDISSAQLTKLHLMVERLLETATLDSEQLLLNLEPSNLQSLILSLSEKFQTLTNKKIEVKLEAVPKMDLDAFHFENAISNLIDNAIKYGGDAILISLRRNEQTEILIQDTGRNLAKSQLTKIFEKFYRVPKGNVHDTKGFGIGLYYTKNIVEKHGGTIQAYVDDEFTTFKITLP